MRLVTFTDAAVICTRAGADAALRFLEGERVRNIVLLNTERLHDRGSVVTMGLCQLTVSPHSQEQSNSTLTTIDSARPTG